MRINRTGIYRGEKVLAALESLGGEANTEGIAQSAGIGPVAALVTCGQLSKIDLIHKCEKGNKKANPRWRLPVVGEEGYDG